jgi:hypothetical protein
MRKIGLIARADVKGGLGIQTYRLNRLLKPDKVMLIDSSSFNGNQQYPELYDDVEAINGFPTPEQIADFCKQVDIVISCETFYSDYFVDIARANNTKTILIFNYEFLDQLNRPHLSLPDKLIQPSYWYLDEMKTRFNAEYLPTPIFEDEFEKAREINLKRTGRKFLFMNGKTAAEDRNGLQSLYRALELSKGDFTVTVKAQNDVPKHPDPRLIYDFTNPENQNDLYEGFDCLIQPRRYGGQTLSMTEALQSAMPVIMTDIEPNNKVLPKEWLVPAKVNGQLMTRIMLDVYDANSGSLADMLDTTFVTKEGKKKACAIGKQYDAETLRSEYEALLSSL